MSFKQEDPNFFRATLELPRYRVEDWIKWLDAFFTQVRGDEVGQQIDLVRPEFTVALASFVQRGMSPERAIGFVLGISAIQYLHFTGALEPKLPPELVQLDERMIKD